ncbi:hypothetical protein LWI29_021188 [Acer saccharum]|uniref:Uncharacterized protein n=1 Tax=Acer saccharum TaxID=4024 RepID=A0AA39VDV2_ACESA|nr:hypothetical protein LWI29_021188 [Acer saccharum]
MVTNHSQSIFSPDKDQQNLVNFCSGSQFQTNNNFAGENSDLVSHSLSATISMCQETTNWCYEIALVVVNQIKDGSHLNSECGDIIAGDRDMMFGKILLLLVLLRTWIRKLGDAITWLKN